MVHLQTHVWVLSPRAKLSQILLLLLFQPPAHSGAWESWSPSVPGPSWWDVHVTVQTFVFDHLLPSESRRKDTWLKGLRSHDQGQFFVVFVVFNL